VLFKQNFEDFQKKSTNYLSISKKTATFALSFINLVLLFEKKGVYQSGQMGQTVNLLVYAYGGSNPSAPTIYIAECGFRNVEFLI
jgi:hypothetical protein